MIFYYIQLNARKQRNLFCLVANCEGADKKQFVRRFDLDIESAQCQTVWCRARPTCIDDGLERITLIHGLGGVRLPAAFYGRISNLKNIYYVFPFEMD